MNRTKGAHTALPWRTEPYDPAVLVLGGQVIGTVGPDTATREEQEANAALIVRAVNSHAELLKLVAEAVFFLKTVRFPEDPEAVPKWLASTRAAIARIEEK